jgi:hypothetical protein
MSTFYMVEMNYPESESRAEFDAFYDGHIAMLLSIEGFRSAQRFACVHGAKAPYLALYRLASPEVLTSENYTSKAGRMSVNASMRERITNWDRNLVSGPIDDMDVAMGGWMVLVDRLDPQSPPLPDGFAPLTIIGLDKTLAERGVRIGDTGEPATPDASPPGWRVRTLRPIHPPRFPQ